MGLEIGHIPLVKNQTVNCLFSPVEYSIIKWEIFLLVELIFWVESYF